MNFMKYLHAYYVFYKYKFYVPRIKIYTWISGEPLLALTGNQLEIDINTHSKFSSLSYYFAPILTQLKNVEIQKNI